MKPHYISPETLSTEQGYHNDFKEEAKRIEDEIYSKKPKVGVKKGLILAIDRDIERRIET